MSKEHAVPIPEFGLGDRVYLQTNPHVPKLFTDGPLRAPEKHKPQTVTVRGIVHTCEFDRGYSTDSRPVPGSETIKYLTSYNSTLYAAEYLYLSVRDFELRRGDEIAAAQGRREAEAEAKRLKEYRAAKRLVTDFEADFFTAKVSDGL